VIVVVAAATDARFATPLTVTVVVRWLAAEDCGVNVTVLDPPLRMFCALNAAVTPLGKPDTLKLTVPEKPFKPVTLIASLAERPPWQ